MLFLDKINYIINTIFFFSDLKICLKVIKKKNGSTYNLATGSSAYNWATSSIDTYTLRKIIKIYNPKNILELGTGIGASTEAMIDQMSDAANLVSLENNNYCINEVKKKLSSPLFAKKKFKIIKTDIKICRKKINIETLIYKISPKLDVKKYDLIYIDGPSFFFKKKKLIFGLARGDFFYYYNKIKIGCIVVVDGSIITQKEINRFCSTMKNLRIFKCFAVQKVRHDNLLDTTYRRLKTWGYI